MNLSHLPTVEEIQQKTRIRYHKKRRVTIEVVENVHFRVFGINMVLPKGLKSDGNSLPFFLLPFMSPYDIRWLFAGILHDYIYRTQFLPRDIADAIFREILKITASKFTSYCFYKGVRYGGWYAWRKNSKKLVSFPKARYDLNKEVCKDFTN